MTTGGREARGVYYAPHTIDGFRVLYAVKRNGDRLPRVVVLRPMVDEAAAVAWLEQQLDKHDPGPRLVLDRPAPPLPPPPESNLSYTMRRAQQYSRLPRYSAPR